MSEQFFSLSTYYFNNHAIPFFVVGFLIVFEAFFVYKQNPRALLNLGFAAVTVCAGLWLTGVGLVYCIHDPEVAVVISRAYCWLGIIFISPSVFFYSAVWRDGDLHKLKRWVQFNFGIAVCFYIYCIGHDSFVPGMWEYPWGLYSSAGPGETIFLVWYVILMLLSFRNFIQRYVAEKNETHKKNTGFVILAFVFGGIGGSIDFLGNYGIELYPFGGICVLLFSTVIAYSIVNYRFMDIETVIHKTIIWMASFLIMIIPLIIGYLLFYTYAKNHVVLQISYGVASLIIYLIYLHTIQPKIDHLFQRRKANLEEMSSQFVEDLVHLEGIDRLAEKIDEVINLAVYPQWIDIFVYDEAEMKYHIINNDPLKVKIALFQKDDIFLEWLKKNNSILHRDFIGIDPQYEKIKDIACRYFDATKAIVIIPLVVNERLLGVIHLGKKANLKRYKAVEFQFLNTIKNQSAIAISNSLIYEDIERQVKQRTQELVDVQKQLIQAEKLATVGTLSGGVAHEINNPLTAILTNVQMILAIGEENGDDVKADRESLEMIEEATKRCRDIVQKLMTYAKKPAEKEGGEKVDLAQVIDKTVAFINYQIQQDGIDLDVKKDGGPSVILGNANEIEQIITNLVLNARDAIKSIKPSGQIEISLKSDASCVTLSVKDDGPGIKSEDKAKIFDPFFTTKDVGKGLGLGLSICQSIVEKWKGKFEVVSSPDQGCMFKIKFAQASSPEENP